MDQPVTFARKPVGPPPLALRLAAILVVPLLLYALVAIGQKALENYRLNQEADGLRAEIVSLRNQNIALQQQLEAARSDAAIEAIAREQLGLVKPGDKPLVIVSDHPAAAAHPQPAAASTPTPGPTPPPWRQWWDEFFG